MKFGQTPPRGTWRQTAGFSCPVGRPKVWYCKLRAKAWSANAWHFVGIFFRFHSCIQSKDGMPCCLAALQPCSALHVLRQRLPLSVWGLTTGSPLCLRSRSFSLSFLSWEWERDLQRDSLDRERRCRDLLDRDEDRDRLLLGDLRQTKVLESVSLKCHISQGKMN